MSVQKDVKFPLRIIHLAHSQIFPKNKHFLPPDTLTHV